MSNDAGESTLEPSELLSPRSNSSAELEQLREKVKAQEKQIQSLYDDLDMEREASASAINETMEMIRRLNYEKSAVQLEAQKMARFAELAVHHKEESPDPEKEHDVKDDKIAELEVQMKAYRERMKRHGIEPDEESEGGTGVADMDDGDVDATMAMRADMEMEKSDRPKFSFFGVFNVIPQLFQYSKSLFNGFLRTVEPRGIFGLNISSIGFMVLIELSRSWKTSRSLPLPR